MLDLAEVALEGARGLARGVDHDVEKRGPEHPVGLPGGERYVKSAGCAGPLLDGLDVRIREHAEHAEYASLLLEELADRWELEEHDGAGRIWFEIDRHPVESPSPGRLTARRAGRVRGAEAPRPVALRPAIVAVEIQVERELAILGSASSTCSESSRAPRLTPITAALARPCRSRASPSPRA